MSKRKLSADKTGAYYDQWHQKYLDHYGNTFQAHRPADINELHRCLDLSIGFSDGDKVLDAGCGVCGPALYFAAHNKISIEALTNSKKQLATAEKLIKESHPLPAIHLQLGDFQQMDRLYAPETFDKIIFLESFGHSPDKAQLVKAAFTILKFGGCIYIKDYFANEIIGPPERKKLMKRAVKNMNQVYCYWLADLYETIRELRKLGMAVEFINKPRFELSNREVVDLFEKESGIDLFNDEYMPVIVEALEMKFSKPGNDIPLCKATGQQQS